MAKQPVPETGPAAEARPVEAPVWSVVAVVALVVAAWIAAGSTGVLADPLRRVLTWAALLAAVVAGVSRPAMDWAKWLGLAGAIAVALLMTAAPQSEAQVLAVALIGAAIAWLHRDRPRHIVLLGALGAMMLAVFRIAAGAIPSLYLAANGLTGALGRLAGALAGEPLEVGATYGGLDFLLVAAVVYVGWLCGTPAPRLRRGLVAAAAIVLGHFAYLALLAHTDTLVAMLPERALPPESDRSYLGVWTWGNAARRLLPWNLPLAAAVIHGGILSLVLRWSPWLPVADPEPELTESEKRKRDEQLAGKELLADITFRFGPVVLALLLPLLGWLAVSRSDLSGKTIVAYEAGYLDWFRPTHENPEIAADDSFGMLPVLVESLGGTFLRSEALSADDLARADAVLLIHPDQPWQPGQLQRLWDYVRGGGALLLVAEPRVVLDGSVSRFDAVLEPTAIRVHDNTTIGHQPNWQDGFEAQSHPSVAGLDARPGAVGFRFGSSLDVGWPARPVLVGRYGYGFPGSDPAVTAVYRYAAGHRLGDLTLAAEQRFGAGRVFVLGDTSTFANQMLPESYPFAGRLLGYLAGRGGTPQAGWRQVLTLLAAAGLMVLLCRRPAAPQIGLVAVVLAATLASAVGMTHRTARVLPDGRGHKPRNNIAYITADHAEFFSREPFDPNGLASFQRTLMRNDYLPLLAPDLSEGRLERAGLLVTIAPARAFSGSEIARIVRFVQQGGHFIAMVGAEEARPSKPLLEAMGFYVPPSPVHPGETIREPIPLGAFEQPYYEQDDFTAYARMWNGWPVERTPIADDAQGLPLRNVEVPDADVVLLRRLGSGTATIIGDSYFALNRNFEELAPPVSNEDFWRWQLARTAGPRPWYPTPSDDADEPVEPVEPDEEDNLLEMPVLEESPPVGPGAVEPDDALRGPDDGPMPDDLPALPDLEPPSDLDELEVPDQPQTETTVPDSAARVVFSAVREGGSPIFAAMAEGRLGQAPFVPRKSGQSPAAGHHSEAQP